MIVHNILRVMEVMSPKLLLAKGVLRMVAVLRGLNQGEFADLAAARDGEPAIDPAAWSLKPPSTQSRAYSSCCVVLWSNESCRMVSPG